MTYTKKHIQAARDDLRREDERRRREARAEGRRTYKSVRWTCEHHPEAERLVPPFRRGQIGGPAGKCAECVRLKYVRRKQRLDYVRLGIADLW